MKIEFGSGANTKFSMINIGGASGDEEKIPEQPQETEEEAQGSATQGAGTEVGKISLSYTPANMMASSFVHAIEANDDDNYSLKSLKSMQSEQSLMVSYNSRILNIMDERMVYVEDLVDAGVDRIDAKYAAAGIYGKKGDDAHKKLGQDIDEEELEKQAEESKKFNEERTEEVVEEKQKEKAAEEKESAEKTEAKVEEEVAEKSREAVKVMRPAEEGAANVAAVEGSDGSDDGVEVSSASTDKGPIIKGTGTGENVDKLV